MSERTIFCASLMLAAVLYSSPRGAQAQPAPDKGADEFFESRIRPILVEHCVGCHGPTKQEMGLRLDSAAGLRRGSDSGPVVRPGVPGESRLVEVVRYDGDTKMPPKKKLPDVAIESLRTWIQSGAVWPQESTDPHDPAPTTMDWGKTHWAFQPIAQPPLPAVEEERWVASPVDAFILARLEAAGMKPSPSCDHRTLLRRATFDLLGLPPTPEEVAAFEADASPDAWSRVVERLLASPCYGQRWGRHWLDVARYADTKGYVRLNENPNYVASWTYRDYVIRAFNEDLPYDEFVRQQLAADQLDLGDDPRPLAAMGFLTLGPRFINSQHDIIDDRIDVVTRGLLGLTVTCARCHDHKFDPIPTRDYYSLHGVFASSTEPRTPPVIVTKAEQAKFEPYVAELQRRIEQLDEFLRAEHAALSQGFLERAGDYLLTAQGEQVQANFLAVMFLVDARKDLNPVMVQRWARLLEQSRKRHDPVLAPWNDLSQLPAGAGGEFAKQAQGLAEQWRRQVGPEHVNQVVLDALSAKPPQSLAEAAQLYGDLLRAADEHWRQSLAADPGATHLSDANWDEIRRLVSGPDAPLAISLADVEELLFVDATRQQELHKRQRLVEEWISSPGAAPHAMVLEDSPQPADSPVFIRGNPSNPGEVAPRQFPAVLARDGQRPFQHGSGRLELAEAIVAADNPLTARVMVNHVWMHHFGAGLVRTPSDFGLRGEAPTHPELLDYLAYQFMREGWSIKQLHRTILLSSSYQQSSNASADAAALDPENRLWGRMNRRRLDWESLRDSLLAASGRLDLAMGGPGVDLFQTPFSSRRAVYGLIDRQSLPSALRTFDFAPPDATSPQRHQTTSPQQSLFLMNSPFLKEQVQELAVRREFAGAANRQRIDLLYRRLFGRPADLKEIALAEEYLRSPAPPNASTEAAGDDYLSSWEEYVQALLLSNEFVFVD